MLFRVGRKETNRPFKRILKDTRDGCTHERMLIE